MDTFPQNNDIEIIDIPVSEYKAISENERELFFLTINECLRDREKNQDMSPKEWLAKIFKASLPEMSETEIQAEASEICSKLNENEENLASLRNAVSKGKSKESWFADKMEKTAELVGMQRACENMDRISKASDEASELMLKAVTRKDGNINMLQNLDGFIAEQHHANTFNIRAEAMNSPLRARVLDGDGHGYAKDSVDIVIEDLSMSGHKVVKRYQSKYCSDSYSTEKAYEHGDYRGQRLLAPSDQTEHIQRKSTDRISADGIESDPFSKQEAKEMQRKFQDTDIPSDIAQHEYDRIKFREQSKDLAKCAGKAALIGAVNKGMDKAEELHRRKQNGEDIDDSAVQIAKAAVEGGADSGVKVAIAGAVKIAAQKAGKNIEGAECANIAFAVVEEAKIAHKVAKGELTPMEGLDRGAEVAVAVGAGVAAGYLGAVGGIAVGGEVGMAVGALFGPVGIVVGACVGMAVGEIAGASLGYSAGEKAGKKIYEGAKKMAEKAKSAVKKIASGFSRGMINETNYKISAFYA